MAKTEIQEPKRNSVDSISLMDYILEQSIIKNIYRKTHKKILKKKEEEDTFHISTQHKEPLHLYENVKFVFLIKMCLSAVSQLQPVNLLLVCFSLLSSSSGVAPCVMSQRAHAQHHPPFCRRL